MTEKRPEIATITSGAELKRWYWLKEELVLHARALSLATAGGKFELLDRIAHFLDTGERLKAARRKARSDFDWHGATLSDETVITDSYRNSQNVRRYFKSRCGDSFKFNTAFMAWMKDNAGKTLADAVIEYERLQVEARAPQFESRIADHNQFNQYTRDFLADNSHLGMPEVRKFWALKRALPSEDGRHVYEPSDLDLA
ncbi:DUF6434 domain-containing protein [Pontivivens insulae]|uniref:DUF6434 domain-containing protein n=1 Tax=Pontivivens insulae TaxID=1639689 RepID=A0A2R8AC49_9RHOB|nr:DUF6434 domain-containing protein [Pontivivens insulae]RED11034.1 hypothetical protein DFR53_3063 [Pontivivens insulae]SPF29791.1 hypothetical protein POI8812_02108 [Pontivivens insulae]